MAVKKGDLLLEAEPFAYALDEEFQSVLCDNCIERSITLMRCGGCQFVKYCSKNCQKNGWKIHKRECHLIRENKPEFDTLFYARIILRLQDKNAKPDPTKGLVSETKIRNFWDLISHEDEICKNEIYCVKMALTYQQLKILFGENFQTTSKEFIQIFCRATINSFGLHIHIPEKKELVGKALYLMPSAFDHSCKRNTVSSIGYGTKMIFRSAIDWPKFDSAKIRVSYLGDPVLKRTAERRKILKEKYYFWCECELCNDVERDQNMSSIRCGNENCDAAVYVDMDLPKEAPIGKCPKCSFNSFNSNTRRKYYKFIDLIKTLLQQKDYGSLRKVIENPGNILHELNIYLVTAHLHSPLACEMNLQHIQQMKKAVNYYCKGYETTHELLEPLEYSRLAELYASLNESNISE